MTDEKFNVAAVIYTEETKADNLLKEFVDELKIADWNIQGLLTKHSKKPMIIYSIKDYKEFTISQEVGKGSQSCSLDLGALAATAFVLRDALEDQADLVIINRFGTAEASGRGLINEIQALISHNIPVLTMVNEKYLVQWLNFTGDMATNLPANKVKLHDWFKHCRSPSGC